MHKPRTHQAPARRPDGPGFEPTHLAPARHGIARVARAEDCRAVYAARRAYRPGWRALALRATLVVVATVSAAAWVALRVL